MEELIPILIWGFLLFVFGTGGAKKQRQKKAQMARQAMIEARRQRMAQDQAAGGLVGVADDDEEPADDRAREEAWGTREPMREDPPLAVPPAGSTRSDGDPQVPRNVWELVEALARGTLPDQIEAANEELETTPADAAGAGTYEPRRERALPAPAADAAPRAERAPPVPMSIQARGQARSDAGISGVDAVEHAEGADPTLTEVDDAHHSKVAAAVARARARRKAGQSREQHSLFGMGGRKSVRRAIVLSEVLGHPTSLRAGLDPHRPPE